jgi:hypothetical protein
MKRPGFEIREGKVSVIGSISENAWAENIVAQMKRPGMLIRDIFLRCCIN